MIRPLRRAHLLAMAALAVLLPLLLLGALVLRPAPPVTQPWVPGDMP